MMDEFFYVKRGWATAPFLTTAERKLAWLAVLEAGSGGGEFRIDTAIIMAASGLRERSIRDLLASAEKEGRIQKRRSGNAVFFELVGGSRRPNRRENISKNEANSMGCVGEKQWQPPTKPPPTETGEKDGKKKQVAYKVRARLFKNLKTLKNKKPENKKQNGAPPPFFNVAALDEVSRQQWRDTIDAAKGMIEEAAGSRFVTPQPGELMGLAHLLRGLASEPNDLGMSGIGLAQKQLTTICADIASGLVAERHGKITVGWIVKNWHPLASRQWVKAEKKSAQQIVNDRVATLARHIERSRRKDG